MNKRYVFYESDLQERRGQRRCLALIVYTLLTTGCAIVAMLSPGYGKPVFELAALGSPLLPVLALDELGLFPPAAVKIISAVLAAGMALTPLLGWFLTNEEIPAGPKLIRFCMIAQIPVLLALCCFLPFLIFWALPMLLVPALTLRALRKWQQSGGAVSAFARKAGQTGGAHGGAATVPVPQKEVSEMEKQTNDLQAQTKPSAEAIPAAGASTYSPQPGAAIPGASGSFSPAADEPITGGPGGPGAVWLPPAAYPRRRGQGRDLVLAGLLLAFCFLFWDSVCWAAGLGVGEALGLAALLPAALWYLRGRPGKLGVYGLACAGLYLLGALSLIFSGDASLKILTVFALAPLFLIVILERLGLRTGLGLRQRLRDLGYLLFGMGFWRINAGAWALSHAGEEDSVRSRRRTAILLGLLCAIPALLILMPLLISSDAAFAGLMGKLDVRVLGRFLLAMVLAGLLALLLFTLLFSSDRGPKALSGGPRRGVEPAAVIAFLAAVGAAYVLYLIAQFAYFTDAFRGLLPKDFTVAEYARRGFFEMCAIVAINLVLIVLAVGLCRKEGGKLPGAVKALALFLCAFSLALVATAISKMVLYMHSLGLTRLRLLTSAFMIFLAAVVLAVALRLFVRRVPVVQLAVSLGAAILIVLSLVNVDGLVARYNVDAWRTGKLDSLDVETVCMLGDGAVPVLTELAKDGDPTVSAAAEKELTERLVSFGLAKWQRVQDSSVLVPGDGGGIDLRSWNLISARAYEALCAYHDG